MNIDTIKPCFFVIQIGNIWWNQLPCHTILGSQTTHEYEAMKCVLGSIIRNQIHMNILNYKITYIYMNVTEWGKHSNGHFLFQGPSQTKKTSWALQHFPAVWPFLKTSSSCFSRHDQCAMTQLVESQNPQLHPSEKSRNESDFFRWFFFTFQHIPNLTISRRIPHNISKKYLRSIQIPGRFNKINKTSVNFWQEQQHLKCRDDHRSNHFGPEGTEFPCFHSEWFGANPISGNLHLYPFV